MATNATTASAAAASTSSLQDLIASSDNKPPTATMLPVVLSKTDFANLLDISQRIKAIREPVRELMRCANISSASTDKHSQNAGSAARDSLLAQLKGQLEMTQSVLSEYLLQVPGVSNHPAITRVPSHSSGQERESDKRSLHFDSQLRNRSSTQGSQDSATYRMSRPQSFFTPDSLVPHYTAATLPALPESSRITIGKEPAGSSATTASALAKSPSLRKSDPRAVSTSAASSDARPAGKPAASGDTIENCIVRLWQSATIETAPAKPVNDVYVKLGKRHIGPLEERIPHIPFRELSSKNNTHINSIDLINSLLRSSVTENEASHLTKQIETIPPGIVACAIANSTSQLFLQLDSEGIKQYAASSSGNSNSGLNSGSSSPASAQSILRMLSDHANFLTRFMETTIIYPIHASQRAKRIEWWTVVACLLRELGDYESLNSLVCVFSSATLGRLRDSWELVSSQCKGAIRFILERVLKIHPNYANYRDELQSRIKKMQKMKKKSASIEAYAAAMTTALGNNGPSTEGNPDEASLDFDNAVAINTPDLCSSNDNYVNSCVYCKEEFDLPPPRALVPIVAVLLKDAVSSEATGDSSGSTKSVASSAKSNTAAETAPQWASVIESCKNQDLPLSLDYYMLRRVFSTELSTLAMLMPPVSQQSSTPRALSAASNFLKRMPRRQSSTEKSGSSKELSLTQCRLLGDSAISASRAPHIVDILAHFLYLAAGNPCYTCSVGSPLDDLHVATSGQLAVIVTTILLFSEPWLPREYLTRLCDLREPRLHSSTYSSKSPSSSNQAATTVKAATISAGTQPSVVGRMSMSSHSHGYESRSSERPWLMSFKLSDSMDSSRYYKNKGGGSSKHSSIESARKTSTDSDSTCVNRAPSPTPNGFANPDKDRRNDAADSSLSFKATLPPEGVPSSGHRRSLSSHSIQSNNSKSAFSAISPTLPELPPLPTNINLPPLPSANMPTWLPNGVPAAAKSPLPSLKSQAKSPLMVHDALLTPPPPPLPAQPMPRFQPSGNAKSPPPPQAPHQLTKSPQLSAVQTIPAVPGIPSSVKKQPTDISAETQMLLSFEPKGNGR
ncbi:Ras guanine nucleotide exchange factor bud5 [Coemansia spiralis]|uniref:Ras guanine nucleotide exchange factor bud5 n=1 Tax=Coemansia spiralis TaxID=417178 RepID=A0A9W8GAM3_9FUNG|nr:hypothetical protein BX070DRAFT_95137 [Coemansia spiralis]KAJ2678367.1 Ras guanine nucleotide exchange factor bud5 [Coemansia spiralis]